MTDLFDAEAMYDADYLHFFADPARLEGDLPQAHVPDDMAAALAWQLLALEPGMHILDLGCGHGRIANRLAAWGCRVTGLDPSEVFLERARQDAAALGVEVEYVRGDMRDLPWTDRFDGVVSWSTAFGYFDDTTNRRVLEQIQQVLRPDGQVAIDLDNLVSFLRGYQPTRVIARDDGDMLVDRYHLDPLTGRFEAERTIVRDSHTRRVHFVKRILGFPELRDWLRDAGFGAITGHGEDGQSLTATHERMIAVARKSGAISP
jgi:SAM-dependent methyltransferase